MVAKIGLLFVLVAIAAHEFLDSASRVDDLLLSCVKRVGERANVNVDDEMLDPVDCPSLVGLHRGDPLPLMFAIHEQNGMIDGMGFCLHEELHLGHTAEE